MQSGMLGLRRIDQMLPSPGLARTFQRCELAFFVLKILTRMQTDWRRPASRPWASHLETHLPVLRRDEKQIQESIARWPYCKKHCSVLQTVVQMISSSILRHRLEKVSRIDSTMVAWAEEQIRFDLPIRLRDVRFETENAKYDSSVYKRENSSAAPKKWEFFTKNKTDREFVHQKNQKKYPSFHIESTTLNSMQNHVWQFNHMFVQRLSWHCSFFCCDKKCKRYALNKTSAGLFHDEPSGKRLEKQVSHRLLFDEKHTERKINVYFTHFFIDRHVLERSKKPRPACAICRFQFQHVPFSKMHPTTTTWTIYRDYISINRERLCCFQRRFHQGVHWKNTCSRSSRRPNSRVDALVFVWFLDMFDVYVSHACVW